MSDKAIIIIFCILNLCMWVFVWDYMIRTKRMDMDVIMKTQQAVQKQDDYMHCAHENIRAMTEMNIASMQKFLEQISVKIGNEDMMHYETENRQ